MYTGFGLKGFRCYYCDLACYPIPYNQWGGGGARSTLLPRSLHLSRGLFMYRQIDLTEFTALLKHTKREGEIFRILGKAIHILQDKLLGHLAKDPSLLGKIRL